MTRIIEWMALALFIPSMLGCAARKPVAAWPAVPDNCIRNLRCTGHWHVEPQEPHRIVCDAPLTADLACVPAK